MPHVKTTDITASWIRTNLGLPAKCVELEPIASDFGFASEIVRVHISGESPTTLIAKLPRDDQSTEVEFYRDIAPKVRDVYLPKCYFSEPGIIILEELGPGRCGNVIDGCTPKEATAVVTALATFHRQFWQNDTTLIHSDFHLDNIFFFNNGEVAIFDWQRPRRGMAMVDLARFLGSCVEPEVLKKHHENFLETYIKTLDHPWERFIDAYKAEIVATEGRYLKYYAKVDQEKLIPRQKKLWEVELRRIKHAVKLVNRMTNH